VIPRQRAQFGSQLLRHADRVACVRWSPDGTMLASGSWDGTVAVWDAESGARLSSWSGHVGPVHAIGIDQRNGEVLSCGEDGTVRRWSSSGSAPPFALLASPGPLHAMCVQGGLVHVAGAEGAIYTIEIDAGLVLPTIRRHEAAIEPTALSADHRFALGRRGGDLEIWEVDAPAEAVATVGRDARLDGNPLGRSVIAFGGIRLAFRAWPRRVGGLALGRGGSHVYSCGEDGGVREWDMASEGAGAWFARDAGVVRAIHVDVSSELVWTAGDDGSIRAYRDGVPVRTATVSSQPLLALTAASGKMLAAGQDTYVHAVARGVGTSAGDRSQSWRGHFWHVTSLDPHPSAPLLASASKDYTIRIWSTGTGREVTPRTDAPDDYIDAVAWSDGPGRPSVIAGSEDGSIRRWWLDGHSTALATMCGQVHALSIAPGSCIAIAADDRGTVIGIDISTGQSWEVVGPTNRDSGFMSVASLEADGVMTALGVRRNGQVCRLGAGGIEVIGEVACGPIVSASVSSGLTKVAVGDRVGNVVTHEIVDGAMRPATVDNLHGNDWVTALAWSSDGTALVSGGWDRVAWLRRDGRVPVALRGHTETIRVCGFDWSGTTCVTGSWDGRLRSWRTEDDTACGWTTVSGRPVSLSVLVCESGTLVATGNADTTVTVLELGEDTGL